MKKVFDQLLMVKKQRERSTRSRLEEILREQDAVRLAASKTREEIGAVMAQWHALLQRSGAQSRDEFNRLRTQLMDLSARERALKDRMGVLEKEWQEIEQREQAQRVELGKVLRSQEKLKYMRDEWVETEGSAQ